MTRISMRSVLRLAMPALAAAVAMPAPPARAVEAAPALTMGVSKDGAYVLDARANIAWSRCVEGMRWTGRTCAGKPLLFSHDEALALARKVNRERGLEMRLPRLKELQALVPKTDDPPGLDVHLFPGDPRGWQWSATPALEGGGGPGHPRGPGNNAAPGPPGQNIIRLGFPTAWAVDMSTGESRDDLPKRTKLPVRLVLPLGD